MTDLKGSRAESRLEKAARETGNAGLHYEVEARAVREEIARLRALRIAKEMESAALGEDVVLKKSITKRAVNSTKESAPSASPSEQPMGGLRD